VIEQLKNEKGQELFQELQVGGLLAISIAATVLYQIVASPGGLLASCLGAVAVIFVFLFVPYARLLWAFLLGVHLLLWLLDIGAPLLLMLEAARAVSLDQNMNVVVIALAGVVILNNRLVRQLIHSPILLQALIFLCYGVTLWHLTWPKLVVPQIRRGLLLGLTGWKMYVTNQKSRNAFLIVTAVVTIILNVEIPTLMQVGNMFKSVSQLLSTSLDAIADASDAFPGPFEQIFLCFGRAAMYLYVSTIFIRSETGIFQIIGFTIKFFGLLDVIMYALVLLKCWKLRSVPEPKRDVAAYMSLRIQFISGTMRMRKSRSD
jgi:hypothetical protein